MAHHQSAKKAIRQTHRRTLMNRMGVSRIRTFIRKVEDAIQSLQKTDAQEALKQAQPEIMKGVTKGLLHRNTASRKISRLSSRIRKIA